VIPYVVGLDFSITASGVADSTGRAVTVGKKGVTALPLVPRCLALQQVGGLVWGGLDLRGDESVLVIETLEATGRGNGALIERGFVWYWLVTAALEHGFRVVTVNPSVVKKYATGHGDANKREILTAVTSWGKWPVGRDNNKADAAVLCAIGMHLLGAPVVEEDEFRVKVLEGLSIEGKS
jgi:hypothetical protein